MVYVGLIVAVKPIKSSSKSAKAHREKSISAVNRRERTKIVALKRMKEMRKRFRTGRVEDEVFI